jgi:hypothetical protein
MPRKPTKEEILGKVNIRIRDGEIAGWWNSKTMRNKISSGKCPIPYTKFGHHVLFKLSDVLAYLEKNEVRPEAG